MTTSPQEEEVYFFRSDPRDYDIDLLLTVDEASYARKSIDLMKYRFCSLKFKSDTGQSTGNYNQGEPHPIGKLKLTARLIS